MKFKKMVLMGLLCWAVSAFEGMPVPAAEAETVEVQEDAADIQEEQQEQEDAALTEGSGEDIKKADEEEADIYALTEDFSEEVANLESLLESSISSSVAAMIENEQAKLPSYTQEELMYLSCIIYCEAGSQPKKGKIAVANVIMNRAESAVFDHVTTIKEVIYDCERWGRQFSPVYVKVNGKWTTKGSNYEKVLTMYKTGDYPKQWQKDQMQDCIEAAKEALTGERVIGSSYLYFNMGISSGKAKCEKNGKPYIVIGSHIFY